VDIRVHRPRGISRALEPREEPLTPHRGAHHEAILHPHIVTQLEHISARAGDALGTAHHLLGDTVQQEGGHLLALDEVQHQLVHPADLPRNLPDVAGEPAHGEARLMVGASDLPGRVRHGVARPRVLLILTQRVESLSRKAEAPEVVEVRGYARRAIVIDGGALGEVLIGIVAAEVRCLARSLGPDVAHLHAEVGGGIAAAGLPPEPLERSRREAHLLREGSRVLVAQGHQYALARRGHARRHSSIARGRLAGRPAPA